jgi:signal transduction histidine kinase
VITDQRLQIARDLHDGIAQDLVALGYELDLLLASTSSDVATRRGIRSLRFQVDDLISKVRREMYQLRDIGKTSIQERLTQISEEICGPLLSRTDISEFEIAPKVGVELTSIATELLRNSVRHSGGSQIELHLRQVENHTYLEVRDNGKGGATLDSSRLGLIGIKERVENLGGVFTLISGNSGTRVAITI